MRRRLPLVLLTVVASATAARAHIVPITPSSCLFDPLVISVPAAGSSVTADPPAAADALRIDWDTGANRAKFCLPDPDPQKQCQTPRSRSFTLNGSPGTLTFPPAFNASMFASGDMQTPALPVTLAWNGGTATLPVVLSTALAGTGTTLVAGAPVGRDGNFTLVGVASPGTLPPPLGGTAIVFRLTCTATPPPDLDQFSPAPGTKSVNGTIKTGSLRLRMVLESDQSDVDFTAQPALLQVTAAGVTIASIVLPDGLARAGKHRFTGTADGGTVITLSVSGRSTTKYRLAVRTSVVTMPPVGAGRTDVGVTFDAGGLLARSTRAFRASHAGARLHAG